MATRLQIQEKAVLCTKPDISKKDKLVAVNVNDLGNIRPLVTERCAKDIGAVKSKVFNVYSANQKMQSLASVSQSLTDTTYVKAQGVSLRDLCLEDKKRVADLIRELARLGEEKEHAVMSLQNERKHFQEKILSLVDQQEQIIKDCQVQKELLEHQTLLLKLQQQQQKQLQQQQQPQQQHKQLHQEAIQSKSETGVLMRKGHGQLVHPKFRYVAAADLERNCVSGRVNSETKDKDLPGEEENVQSESMYAPDKREDNWSAFPFVAPPSGLENCFQRPFTAIIDKELANQRQALAVTAKCEPCPPVSNQFCEGSNLVVYESKRVGSDINMKDKKTISLAKNRQMLTQKMVHSDIWSQDCVHKQDVTALHHQPAIIVSQPGDCPVVTGLSKPCDCRVKTGDSPGDCPVKAEGQPGPFVGLRKNDLVNLGHGDAPSAKKNVILTRFIQSQAECVGIETNLQVARVHGDICSRVKQMQTENPVHGGIKKRTPPPASYGPLQAPIMSSTQKSSEFGDSLCINATELVNCIQQAGRLPKHHTKLVECGDVEHPCSYGLPGNVAVVCGNSKQSRTMKQPKKRRRRHQKKDLADIVGCLPQQEMGTPSSVGLHLNKNRQISELERKSELLKQRAFLLEEQVKLREMLADHQVQMEVTNQAKPTATEQIPLGVQDSQPSLKEEMNCNEERLILEGKPHHCSRMGLDREEGEMARNCMDDGCSPVRIDKSAQVEEHVSSPDMRTAETCVSFSHIPREETLSIADIILMLSEQTVASRNQNSPGSPWSLMYNKGQHDTGLSRPEMVANSHQRVQLTKDTLHKIKGVNNVGQVKTALVVPERDSVLELFELRPTCRRDNGLRRLPTDHTNWPSTVTQQRFVTDDNNDIAALGKNEENVHSDDEGSANTMDDEGSANTMDDGADIAIEALSNFADAATITLEKKYKSSAFINTNGSNRKSALFNGHCFSDPGIQDVVKSTRACGSEEEDHILQEVFFVLS